jgi:hypothetical protein
MLGVLAREAITIQDASNISGVSRGFCAAITELREIMPTIDSTALARHPIVRLWASKIHDMAGMGLSDLDEFHKAYEWCKEQAIKEI